MILKYINLGGNMKIRLLDSENYISESLKFANTAARYSRSDGTFKTILQEIDNLPTNKLIQKWGLDHGHSSLLEHVSLHFSLEDIPIITALAICSLKTVHITEKSTRYVDCLTHHDIEQCVIFIDKYYGSEDLKYKDLYTNVDLYRRNIAKGRDIAREYIPLYHNTQMGLTIDLRTLLEFLTSEHQQHSDEVSNILLEELKNKIIEELDNRSSLKFLVQKVGERKPSGLLFYPTLLKSFSNTFSDIGSFRELLRHRTVTVIPCQVIFPYNKLGDSLYFFVDKSSDNPYNNNYGYRHMVNLRSSNYAHKNVRSVVETTMVKIEVYRFSHVITHIVNNYDDAYRLYRILKNVAYTQDGYLEFDISQFSKELAEKILKEMSIPKLDLKIREMLKSLICSNTGEGILCGLILREWGLNYNNNNGRS